MNDYVLDASALLSLIIGETGADFVKEHLSKSVISSVNVSEVAGVLSINGFQDDEITTILGNLVHKVEEFDYEQSLVAGLLRKEIKQFGLSLGDRACISLAYKLGLPVITADKAWAKIKLKTKVKLIR